MSWVGKQKIIDLGKREEQAKKGGAGWQQTVHWQMKVKDIFKILSDIGFKFIDSLQLHSIGCKDPIFNKAKTRRVYYWVDRRLNQTGVLTWCLIGSMSVPGKAGPISNKIRDKVWKCKPNISTPNMEAPDWSGLASC